MSELVRKLLQKTKLASHKRYMYFFHKITQGYAELEAMEAVRPILVMIADSEPLEIVSTFWNFTSVTRFPECRLSLVYVISTSR